MPRLTRGAESGAIKACTIVSLFRQTLYSKAERFFQTVPSLKSKPVWQDSGLATFRQNRVKIGRGTAQKANILMILQQQWTSGTAD